MCPYPKARVTDKPDTIVTGAGEAIHEAEDDAERLSYAHIDGPGITLAYLAEDKSYVCSSFLGLYGGSPIRGYPGTLEDPQV